MQGSFLFQKPQFPPRAAQTQISEGEQLTCTKIPLHTHPQLGCAALCAYMYSMCMYGVCFYMVCVYRIYVYMNSMQMYMM